MERVYSPWRFEHVSRAADNTEGSAEDRTEGNSEERATESSPIPSIFSQIAAETNDSENYIVWRGTSVFVVLNLYPYTNGHVMVIPFRQVGDFVDLDYHETVEMSITVQYCIRWLRAVLRPEGFNVGINLGKSAGAGIPNHLHMHVVPRWSGDTNFTTTVADFRVIPESLESMYNRLAEQIVLNPVVIPSFDR